MGDKTEKRNNLLRDEYISYLLRLFDNEDNRMNKLEGKITQLIAQSGLIISIITFIIPLFYDSLKCISIGPKILLGATFLVTVILLCISIFYASKGSILLKSNKLFAFGIYFLVALTIELLIVSFFI